jgi:hypothetical protein
MTTKARSKQKLPQVSDLSESEVDAWVSRNKAAVNKGLAEARKSLRAGQGREWDFAKFVARAQKRSAKKKQK